MPFPAQKLKDRRAECGLSLDDLGKAIGKTRAYVHQLETGVKGNPSYDVLMKLCQALKVSAGFFADQLDAEPPPAPAAEPATKLKGKRK